MTINRNPDGNVTCDILVEQDLVCGEAHHERALFDCPCFSNFFEF